jgi:hypothetical protein
METSPGPLPIAPRCHCHGNLAWSAGLHHVIRAVFGHGNPLRLRIQEIPETVTKENA